MSQLASVLSATWMQHFRNLDIGILKGIYENRIPMLDSMFIAITDSAAAIAFGIPVVVLVIALVTKNEVRRSDAIFVLLSVLFSAILANILKYTIDLPRPYELYPFIEKLSVGGSPSFPSGHTADAFAFAAATGMVYKKWFILLPVLIWASLVGYSRMCLGVHFPSDVLAGALIGVLCAGVYYLIQGRNKVKN